MRQIYRGKENPIKVYILMSEDHFDVISNINGFTCINDDRNKSEYSKCKACKSKTKCEITQTKISCIKCHRQFNSKTCF